MGIYAGRFRWDTPGPLGGVWRAPVGARLALDLRTVAQMVPPTPTGGGIFISPGSPGAQYRFLANAPGDTVAPADRTWLANQLSTAAFTATTLKGILWEYLSERTDPEGVSAPKPPMPGRNATITFHFEGVRIRLKARGSLLWDKIRTVHKAQYRKIRDEVLAGRMPTDQHRRILGAWLRKYGLTAHRQFVPDDLPDESPLPPGTRYAESFNTADSDTLGPDLTWLDINGNWRIRNNQADVATTTDTISRAEHDLATDDHYGECTLKVIGTGSALGALARYNTGGSMAVSDLYAAVADAASAVFRIYRINSGTPTELGTAGGTPANNDGLQIHCEGSTITCKQNGSAVVGPLTDASPITGNTRGGIWGNEAAQRVDDFAIADLLPPRAASQYRRRRSG